MTEDGLHRQISFLSHRLVWSISCEASVWFHAMGLKTFTTYMAPMVMITNRTCAFCKRTGVKWSNNTFILIMWCWFMLDTPWCTVHDKLSSPVAKKSLPARLHMSFLGGKATRLQLSHEIHNHEVIKTTEQGSQCKWNYLRSKWNSQSDQIFIQN